MKIFADTFTNDELMSDIYDFNLIHAGVIMRVQTKYKTKGEVGEVDVGCGNAFGGKNEDDEAEEGGNEGGAPMGEQIINVIETCNLRQLHLSKADFMTYIKAFLPKLKKELEERGETEKVEVLMKEAPVFIKKIATEFNEFEFYTGLSESLSGSIVFSFWEDPSGDGPVFYLFNDALKEVKC